MKKYKFLEGYENFGTDELTVSKSINSPFQNAINLCEKNNEHFIGIGNPDAEILFIGKEMAIPNNESEQLDKSVKQNVDKWNKNQYKRIPNHNWDHFSPWYPHYLQKNKIYLGKVDNGGTSRTEYFYQQIISSIYEIPEDEKQFLTLHMYAFQSELSTATAPTSAKVNPNERKQSIKNRKFLWQTPFFQGFPITILGIGPNKNYIDPGTEREDVINIVKDFNVEYYEVEYKEGEYKKGPLYIGKKFINVHFSEDGTRMLLHTSHLSASSNELIEEICILCRKFLEGRSTNQGKENVLKYMKKK